ncbi:aminotransferase class V-fold PLP-dependent enzyme [Algoriphagus sp. oki45]|uniref:aminotransferase class V-fold PLP-dependent enzyme n=1 Tax=Algoriphagus sp. oki45 TaxID=3067294 RepID=UPI0027E88360|nr:aminotransferase class V-fold PLP-dependent enzyme [Algoriphagus sp. oki45]
MNQRRTFLQKLGLGLVLPGISEISPPLSEFLSPKSDLPPSEYWNQIRDAFPLSKSRVYFNNGTFGPAPYPVLKKLEEINLSVSSTGEYGNSDKERAELASFLNVEKEELSLTHNTTEGINIMAWGLPLVAGDEVILTTHDHAGNALPWLNRAKLHGIVLKTFSPKNTQEENLDLIKSLCGPKTKVIAIPHITCTTGLVFPIREISEFALSKGIFTAIDGAHGAGTLDLNLSKLGCDFYAGCFHKWMLGPSGTGFLYVRKEKLNDLQAIQIGGYSDTGWDMLSTPPVLKGYVDTAHRFDYGTQSKALFAGVKTAADFHLEIGKAKVEQRIRQLSDLLYDGLGSLGKKVEILTPEEPTSRISMVTFRSNLLNSEELNSQLGRGGFRVRLIHEANLNAIRVSTHIYNSEEEVQKFIHFLANTL